MAARDPIDELMNSALEFERNETASLDRFLAWFSRGTVDVQRDPGQPANEVRVMTVHGAKGLEAPVVILADATADPAKLGRRRSRSTSSRRIGAIAPLLRPKKEERCPPFEEMILARRSATSRSICGCSMSALTRAADRLIVSGVAPKPKKDGSDPRPANSWHVIVEQAMARDAAPTPWRWGTSLVAYGSSRDGRTRRRTSVELAAGRGSGVGARSRRRPKRVRRARSRLPRSPPTTKPRRRRARRCAPRRSAEH